MYAVCTVVWCSIVTQYCDAVWSSDLIEPTSHLTQTKEETWIHHPVRLDYWNYCTIRAATITPFSWNSAVLADNLQWWIWESQRNSSNRSQQQCACITVNFHSITVVTWNIHHATYHHYRQQHRRHKYLPNQHPDYSALNNPHYHCSHAYDIMLQKLCMYYCTT